MGGKVVWDASPSFSVVRLLHASCLRPIHLPFFLTLSLKYFWPKYRATISSFPSWSWSGKVSWSAPTFDSALTRYCKKTQKKHQGRWGVRIREGENIQQQTSAHAHLCLVLFPFPGHVRGRLFGFGLRHQALGFGGIDLTASTRHWVPKSGGQTRRMKKRRQERGGGIHTSELYLKRPDQDIFR